jgi:hypothetical protein
VVGFYGILTLVEINQRSTLLGKLDHNLLSNDRAIIIPIAISIPYMANQPAYERVDGEFEHKGEYYSLVGQRYINDTLYVKCIKDMGKKRIRTALADYVKTFTDNPTDTHQQTHLYKNFIKDFLPSYLELTSASDGWKSSLLFLAFTDSCRCQPSVIHGPPPRA